MSGPNVTTVNARTGSNPGPTWRIGQLAEATGVSVRSLRHYDAIGLLVPSGRNAVGHRRYTAAEVERLHQILALRDFGLSLAEVARLLDGNASDPRDLLLRQLAQVEDSIAAAHRLRDTLLGALATLDGSHAAGLPILKIVELIEVMSAMHRPLSYEALDRMVAERRRIAEALTPAQRAELAAARRRWADQHPDQLAELHRKRLALLPAGWPAEGGGEKQFGD